MAVGVVYQVWARNRAPGKSVIMQRKLFAAIGLAGLLIAGAAALSAAQGGQAPALSNSTTMTTATTPTSATNAPSYPSHTGY
jgi:hypothetical protein